MKNCSCPNLVSSLYRSRYDFIHDMNEGITQRSLNSFNWITVYWDISTIHLKKYFSFVRKHRDKKPLVRKNIVFNLAFRTRYIGTMFHRVIIGSSFNTINELFKSFNCFTINIKHGYCIVISVTKCL